MRTSLTIDHVEAGSGFPQQEVQDRLCGELVSLVQKQARVKGEVLPVDPKVLLTRTINIDSLGVVEILCVLDEVLPFLVDESVVRAGGYSSIQNALTDLLPKIDTRWRKHTGRSTS
jgi:hypothetical protein